MSAVPTVARRLWHRLVRRLGTAGVAGAALLALAMGLALTLPALQRDNDVLAARVAARLAEPPPAPPPSRASTERLQLSRYAASFPSLAQNGADLARLFEIAARHRVELARGEYQLSPVAGAPFVTYTATFPVREAYPRLKEYAAEVLNEMPHASLDELRMERSAATARELDARIRFTLIYRGS